MTPRALQATAAAALAAAAAGGYGLSQLVSSGPPAPFPKPVAATPVCLTTLTVPGKPNAKGVVIWRYGTVHPTTTERVCWTRGYIKP